MGTVPWMIDTPLPEDDPKRKLGLNLPQLLGPLSYMNPAPPAVSGGAGSSALSSNTAPAPLMNVPTASTKPMGIELAQKPPLSEQYSQWAQSEPKHSDPSFQVPTWKKALGLGLATVAGGFERNPQLAGSLAENVLSGPFNRAEEQWRQRGAELETQSRIANTESEMRARERPKPDKPESLTEQEAQAVEELVAKGIPRTDAIGQVKSAGQRDPADKTPPTKNLLQPDGKTHIMERDPKTGNYSIDRGIAPPTFGETGLYEPVEIPAPGGGMQPGSFDKRTGKVKPMAPGQTVIPKPAQAEIDKSLSAARDADNRYKTMTQNQDDALKGNQQAMLSLVANHIGMTLGAQKGARINQAVWEEAIKSTPWLQGIAAKFDNRGYLSGVTLTPEQIRQMTELAKQKREIVWQQAQQTAKQYGIESTVKIPPDLNSQTTGFTPF